MYAWEQIQDTINYIENHLNEEVNIEQLAKEASLSLFYYQRLFCRLVKKPVAEYIRLRRLAKSTDLLLDTNKRILDIALELGFTSHEHFTRSFKSAFQMTPDEYRRNPIKLNRMTKPELLLHYTTVDEGVPLVTDGIVLEINRKTLDKPDLYVGYDVTLPVTYLSGIGIQSGPDPMVTVWDNLHKDKETTDIIPKNTIELGVTLPDDDPSNFKYFAGTQNDGRPIPSSMKSWELPAGEYIVCSYEAENFEALVMDALYKAEQYLFNTWLPKHNLRTAPFCAELYETHDPSTTSMEVWLKIVE